VEPEQHADQEQQAKPNLDPDSLPESGFCAYLSHPDFTGHVETELAGHDAAFGRLYLKSGSAVRSWWAQNIWLEPRLYRIKSIKEASKILRGMQRNWALYPYAAFRRAELIKADLPPISAKPKAFPYKIPNAPMGSWTLLDETHLLASPNCSSPFPNGEILFEENKVDPPSRAYLKLWEALTLARVFPQAGMKCLDAGACPGGWTWVLRQLGAEVIAIDRAELDPRLMADPGVKYLSHSAFTLKPEEIGRVDWLLPGKTPRVDWPLAGIRPLPKLYLHPKNAGRAQLGGPRVLRLHTRQPRGPPLA
jgi:23S rRNA (cytidine2498-2'-O)-methyltransferase